MIWALANQISQIQVCAWTGYWTIPVYTRICEKSRSPGLDPRVWFKELKDLIKDLWWIVQCWICSCIYRQRRRELRAFGSLSSPLFTVTLPIAYLINSLINWTCNCNNPFAALIEKQKLTRSKDLPLSLVQPFSRKVYQPPRGPPTSNPLSPFLPLFGSQSLIAHSKTCILRRFHSITVVFAMESLNGVAQWSRSMYLLSEIATSLILYVARCTIILF